MFFIISTYDSSFNLQILSCLLDKLTVMDHIFDLKKNEIAPKTFFYKEEKSVRQVLKNVY